VVVCSALSSVVASALAHLFTRISDTPIPVFTLPFHVITWMWLLGAQQVHYYAHELSLSVCVCVCVCVCVSACGCVCVCV
jgi:urea transporter